MSLTSRVADIVADMGPQTLDEVCALVEGYSRIQVRDALKNARARNLIHCEGHIARRGSGAGAGSMQAKYFPGPRPSTTKKVAPPRPRPPASVWELGSPRLDPLPVFQGRQYSPLGDWNSEGV